MRLITKNDLGNPLLIRDVRNAAFDLNLKGSEILRVLLDANAVNAYEFTDENGDVVYLDTSCFEREESADDWDEYNDVGEYDDFEERAETAHQERLRLWCRDTFCKRCTRWRATCSERSTGDVPCVGEYPAGNACGYV